MANTTMRHNLTADVQEYIIQQLALSDAAWNLRLEEEFTHTDLLNRAQGRDMDTAWLIICGTLVFFMQCGFAMLEAGVVHPKNVHNILFKNIIDAAIAAICFWLLGWGFAYGEDLDGNGFIGTNYFAASDIYNGAGSVDKSDGWEKWFFQWAFTGTCATIVAGSVAERTKIEAYFIYSFFITSFIYPIVAHWGWGAGWLSAWGGYPDPEDHSRGRILGINAFVGLHHNSNGMIDFAGGGIVHMVGGFSGLVGAIVVGPRRDRFNGNTHDNHPANAHHANKTLQVLGTMILWFTWYGVTCGKTLALSEGKANIAAKAAMNTTIAASVGCIVATFISKTMMSTYEISMCLNGIIAGLVSVTASVSLVEPWEAGLIGGIGAILLHVGHGLLIRYRIDDPLDACVVHGLCGMWGLWATGLFCTDANVQYAAYPNVNTACASGRQLGVQVFASLAIIGWTVASAGSMFLFIAWTVGMRVSDDEELEGLDPSEHGSEHARNYAGLQNYPLVASARPHSQDVSQYSFVDGPGSYQNSPLPRNRPRVDGRGSQETSTERASDSRHPSGEVSTPVESFTDTVDSAGLADLPGRSRTGLDRTISREGHEQPPPSPHDGFAHSFRISGNSGLVADNLNMKS